MRQAPSPKRYNPYLAHNEWEEEGEKAEGEEDDEEVGFRFGIRLTCLLHQWQFLQALL